MARSGMPGDLPDVASLTGHAGSALWTGFSPLLVCPLLIKLNKPKLTERSITGDSGEDSKGGCSQREPL